MRKGDYFNKILLFVLLICNFSCVQKVKIPNDIIPKDKMVALLMDIHLAESEWMGAVYGSNPDSALKLYKKDEIKIFKKHKIDIALYRKSFEFYSKNIQYLDEIYAVLVDSLSFRESLAQKKAGIAPNTSPQQQIKPQKSDSIRRKDRKNFLKRKKQEAKTP